ncbi:hypothetical protein ScPMuIL_004015 [Solemya velum]
MKNVAGIHTTSSTNGTVDDFVHSHWKTFPDVSTEWHYFIGVVSAVICVTGVLGNALVIWIFCRHHSMRTASNMFLVNLAVSDLGFSMFTPLMSISSFSQRWIFGNIACEMYGLGCGLFGLMSINTMAAIAGDRYYAILHPLKTASYMTRKRALFILLIVWIWSTAWAIPPVLDWGAYILEAFQTSCTFDFLTRTPGNQSFVVCLYIGGFFVPLTVIVVSYLKLCVYLKRHTQFMARTPMQSSRNSRARSTRVEIRVARVTMTIVALFVLSWSPYAIVALIAQFGPLEYVSPYVAEFLVIIAKSSAIYNPVVYALSHPKFKVALHRKLPCLFCGVRTPNSISRQSITTYAEEMEEKPAPFITKRETLNCANSEV